MLTKALEKYRKFPIQIKASFWFLVCSFLQKGISTITTPIFTRLLSTDEYGQYNVFNSWLGIVSIIVTLNLFYGVYTQGLVKFDKEKEVFSSSLQGITLILCSMWTVVYVISRNFWNNLFGVTTVQMLAMMLMIWTSSVFNFWAAEQRVKYSYKSLVILTLIVSIAKPTVGIVFVLNADDKVTARILGLALVELVGYTWLFFLQMKRGKVFFSPKFWKYAIRFNLPLIPHYLSQTVLSGSDRIMIRDMVGSSEAGIYGLAYSISLVMMLFNSALTQTLSPWMYQKIKDGKVKDIEKIAFMSLMVIATVNILLILLAPEVVKIFAPPAYYDAKWIIPPVAMSVLFNFSYDLFAKFEFYYEKTKYIMVASVAGAALNVFLNYIFIQLYGYQAAAYTTLICYVIYAIAHFILMNWVCDKCMDGARPYSTKKIIVFFSAFVAIGFLTMLTYYNNYVRYGLLVTIVVLLIIFRKKLSGIVKQFMGLKNKKL